MEGKPLRHLFQKIYKMTNTRFETKTAAICMVKTHVV